MHYLVYLQNKTDKLIHSTVCDEAGLINLLQHLDKTRYTVTEAVKLAENLLSYKEFCRKDSTLETGKTS